MTQLLDNLQYSNKKDHYTTLLPQIEALLDNETDCIANMANIAAILKYNFDFLWVGFYRVVNQQGKPIGCYVAQEDGICNVADQHLVLGPFQGPLACTKIKFGQGVCGTAWKNKQTIIVPNVDEFPGHIACNADSKSEIVVPLIQQDNVVGVLDIDSQNFNHFDNIDQHFLEIIGKILIK
jgi:GAF domain-containing protein